MPKIKQPTHGIAKRIRVVISRLGGLKKTSELTGISVSQLSTFQTGPEKPGRDNLERIARAGSVTVDHLLGFEVAEEPAEYEKLDPEVQKIYREVERFLKTASRQKKRHLLSELRWLREHEEGKVKK